MYGVAYGVDFWMTFMSSSPKTFFFEFLIKVICDEGEKLCSSACSHTLGPSPSLPSSPLPRGARLRELSDIRRGIFT
jgi:hypothetical protein